MSEQKKAKTIDDVEFPTLEELGYEQSEDDGGSIEAQERVSVAKQEKKEGDVKEDVTKDEKTQQPAEETPAYTEQELKAIDKGWTPKDQFKGSPANWRPADIFLEQGELMDKVSTSNKKVTRMERALNDAINLIEKQAEAATVKTKNELLERRNTAIIDSDVESVNTYDKQIKELEVPPPQSDTASNDVLQFVEDNAEWFNDESNENAGMRAFAVRAERELHRNFPQMSEQQRLTKTRELIVKAYPTRFGVKPVDVKPVIVAHKTTQQKVEGASQRREVKDKDITYQDLPPKVKQMVYNIWISSNKKIDRDKCARELLRTGAIEYE